MTHSIGLSAPLAAYIVQSNPPEHPELVRCREETHRLYPANAWFQISQEQGAFMQFLARITRSRRAIEIGVFTGYSALATTLTMRELHGDDAHLVGCDISEEWSVAARTHWAAAGVDASMDLRVGPALTSLNRLLSEGAAETFDYAFIDADKSNSSNYFELVLQLLRPGGLLLVDNVLWAGAVADPTIMDADTEALRSVVRLARDDARVQPTVCNVGDGLLMCLKS